MCVVSVPLVRDFIKELTVLKKRWVSFCWLPLKHKQKSVIVIRSVSFYFVMVETIDRLSIFNRLIFLFTVKIEFCYIMIMINN